MSNSIVSEILRGFAISEHKDSGILIAEKQIILPEKQIIMLDHNQNLAWANDNNIILDGSVFSLKGGRKM